MKCLCSPNCDQEWDQEKANQNAWKDLKRRFYEQCLDKNGWVINEVYRSISHFDSGTGITSTCYPIWRRIREDHAKSLEQKG